MADRNNSVFWMFAFAIFFFWILTKHIQKSNVVTQNIAPNINTCAQGVAIPISCAGYQNIVPVPMAASTYCGTPAPIVRILAGYQQTGIVKPVCALTLCFYDKYMAANPNANSCQKMAFYVVASESASNFVGNAPVNLESILQNFTGFAGRAAGG